MALAPGDAQQELLRLCRTELEEAPCFPEQAGAPWGTGTRGKHSPGLGSIGKSPLCSGSKRDALCVMFYSRVIVFCFYCWQRPCVAQGRREPASVLVSCALVCL